MFSKTDKGYLKGVELRRHGVSVNWWLAAHVHQDNRCHICRNKPSGGNTLSLEVDHDHELKQVRGLLCTQCNRALGQFKDSPAILQNAKSYVQQFKTKPSQIKYIERPSRAQVARRK